MNNPCVAVWEECNLVGVGEEQPEKVRQAKKVEWSSRATGTPSAMD